MSAPGDTSQPEDTRGEGSATLADRTAPGGQGSPDTNQAKAEPHPPSGHEADLRAEVTAPELGTMNVGATDPQAPSHPATGATADPSGGGVGLSQGVPVPSTVGAEGTSERLAPDNGPGPQDDPDLPE